jgi:A nuclease family of the HNH/ENDO VII superfamily with conserved AHH
VRCNPARDLLRARLGASSYRVDAEAHHIFGVEQFNTPLGQRLTNWGIDLNGIENGVSLPRVDYPGRVNSSGVGPSLHRGRTGSAYTDEVTERLSVAKSREEALEILGDLKTELLTGKLKINNAN